MVLTILFLRSFHLLLPYIIYVELCPEMHAMVKNCKHLGKMVNNHQIDNNIINKIAKGPLLEVAILAKMAHLTKIADIAINRQFVNKILDKMAKGPF